tara:strand:- start:1466 stop:1843 length:378 start_codon:yes stop_codon:yes gene_type:complete
MIELKPVKQIPVTDIRPWGYFLVISNEQDYKIKKIIINPKSRLSYQYHNKRQETWVILSGNGIVTIDSNISKVYPGSQILIPPKSKHRIENTSNTENLEFIEVQTGEYFGEDDIVRIQDDYGRIE